MASAELEPIMGISELCPQRGPGAEPLVRGLSPLKLNAFCVVVCLKWRKAAMFMSKDVNLTGLLGDIKEDWGSGGWKSISGKYTYPKRDPF